MTLLSQHQSSDYTKILYIGDSGTGKTGSLTSLVAEGYKLRIIDTDNGLDSLVQFVNKECPDKIGNVEFETRRDKYQASPSGPIILGTPRAFVDILGLLNKWPDGTVPAQWGKEIILVIDSLTGIGNAAFEWAKGMNSGAKDPRNWYFSAQQAVEKMIDMIMSDSFKCNVIIISHVQYKEREDGSMKGYANAIGSALGPVIPKYFNTLVLAESVGAGKGTRRVIKTLPTGVVDLKTPAPFKLDAELPLGTGLSTLFKKLKEK